MIIHKIFFYIKEKDQNAHQKSSNNFIITCFIKNIVEVPTLLVVYSTNEKK